jgi:signal peptidase
MVTILTGIRSTILTIAAIVGAASVVVVGGGLLIGVRPIVVISGSMHPAIETGALLFSAERPASEIAIGDVITVDRPDQPGLVTHRVVEIQKTPSGAHEFKLKGDANRVVDPQRYTADKVGKYLFSVPGLGYAVAFFQTVRGLVVLGVIALALVALFILDPKALRRTPRHAAVRDDSSVDGSEKSAAQNVTDDPFRGRGVE